MAVFIMRNSAKCSRNGDFDKKIPMEKLSYIGNGEIIDNFFSVADDGIKVAAFRQDAVAIL